LSKKTFLLNRPTASRRFSHGERKKRDRAGVGAIFRSDFAKGIVVAVKRLRAAFHGGCKAFSTRGHVDSCIQAPACWLPRLKARCHFVSDLSTLANNFNRRACYHACETRKLVTARFS